MDDNVPTNLHIDVLNKNQFKCTFLGNIVFWYTSAVNIPKEISSTTTCEEIIYLHICGVEINSHVRLSFLFRSY